MSQAVSPSAGRADGLARTGIIKLTEEKLYVRAGGDTSQIGPAGASAQNPTHSPQKSFTGGLT